MKRPFQVVFNLMVFLSFSVLAPAQQHLDWAKKIGGNVHTLPKAQTVDNQGNVYITGDNPFFFITKLDSLGSIIWEKTAASTLHTVNALATDAAGNIYVAGRFFSSHDFDWNDTGEHLITVNEQSFFIAKYDGDGNFIWVHHTEEPNIQLDQLEIDPNGHVVLSGNFTNTANIGLNGATQEIIANEASSGPDTYDIFLAHYDQNGNLLHHINFGGQGNDLVRSISFTPMGAVIAAGQIGTASFDTIVFGAQQYILPASTIQGFLIQLNSDWQISNSLMIEGQLTTITGMDVDESGDIFLTGRFQHNCDINGSENAGGALAGNFFNDLECFAAKYNTDFSLAWGYRLGGPNVQFSKKATLSDQGFWVSGESQGLLNQQVFFYHTDSTFTFHKVGDSGFGQIYLALLDKDTGIPSELKSYASGAGSTITGLNVGRNNTLYFSGQFQGEQTFEDVGLPYDLSSSNISNSNYKISIYIARKTDLCLPIHILSEPQSPPAFCQPSFDYEFLLTGTGLRYQWYQKDIAMDDFANLAGGWNITGTHSNHLEYHSPAGGGWDITPYSLQIVNACGDEFFSDSLVTTIVGNPSVIVDQPNNSAIIGSTANLVVRVLDDYPEPAFQWYKGQIPLVNGIHFSGVDTDTLTINNVVDADEANYYCIVGSAHCDFNEVASISTLLYLEVNLTALGEVKNNLPFVVFPNPALDFIYIDFVDNESIFENIQIVNLQGKVLKTMSLSQNHPAQLSLDVQNIPTGIYFLRIFNKTDVLTTKMMIR